MLRFDQAPLVPADAFSRPGHRPPALGGAPPLAAPRSGGETPPYALSGTSLGHVGGTTSRGPADLVGAMGRSTGVPSSRRA